MSPFRRLLIRLRRYRALLIVGVALIATITFYNVSRPAPPPQVDISQAYTLIQGGGIQRAELNDASSEVVLTTREGSQVRATYVAEGGAELQERLIQAQVPTSVDPAPVTTPLRVLLGMLPILFVVTFIVIMLKTGMLSRSFSAFRGGRGEVEGSIPKVSFSDVAGAAEAIEQCREIVDVIRNPRDYERLGAAAPAGAVLVGPPGTGKTLLARAVAGEAKVPFFSMTGSDFVEVFAGAGASRVRSVFDKARAKGVAIVFIDEIDAVGRRRSSGNDASTAAMNSEEDRTLTALLTEMDGFSGKKRSGEGLVVVIAATNRPETLDPALMRPGRLDRRVEVPLPDPRGREQILAVHARKRTMAKQIDLASVAAQTPGMSGAELEQVINEGSLVAARRKGHEVTQTDLVEAVNIVTLGRARTSALVTPADRLVTAWHEAGHAAVGLLDPHASDPVYVTLVPRGAAGGFTRTLARDDQYLTRAQALAQLRVMMAGRAAEALHFGQEFITHGASGDIEAATSLATEMVTRFGMSRLGLARIEPDSLRLGGEMATTVHAEVDRLLTNALEEAEELLRDPVGAAVCEQIAENLVLAEEMHAGELAALKPVKVAELPSQPAA